jgi:hypothetical protein
VSTDLPRLTAQIIRNNIAIGIGGRDTPSALEWGVEEYFQDWGALFPGEVDGTLVLHPNSAINDEEREALLPLVSLLNQAWEATEGMSAEAFLASEWPPRIEQLANLAYAVMATRGRFSESEEEQEPSLRFAALQ